MNFTIKFELVTEVSRARTNQPFPFLINSYWRNLLRTVKAKWTTPAGLQRLQILPQSKAMQQAVLEVQLLLQNEMPGDCDCRWEQRLLRVATWAQAQLCWFKSSNWFVISWHWNSNDRINLLNFHVHAEQKMTKNIFLSFLFHKKNENSEDKF